MGAVYEAFDRERGQLVAIKTLLRFSPTALYRFKQEFRTLADVVHPNLVRLYELVATDADHVFFAMELVRGVDFLVALPGPRRAVADAERAPSHDHACERARPARRSRSGATPTAPAPSTTRRPRRFPDPRLRLPPTSSASDRRSGSSCGRAARSTRPASSTATSSRPTSWSRPRGASSSSTSGWRPISSRVRAMAPGEREMVGTARYMAPEQATGEAPAPASDWYSVGVMLYEALAGRPPFAGPSRESSRARAASTPGAARVRRAASPPDLDALCVELLRREPARGRRATRSSAAGGRRVSPSQPLAPDAAARARGATLLIGREAELRALREAFEAAQAGRLVTVRVPAAAGHGQVGARAPLPRRAGRDGATLVLRGRVYERETCRTRRSTA